jgi:hypothetical protein
LTCHLAADPKELGQVCVGKLRRRIDLRAHFAEALAIV